MNIAFYTNILTPYRKYFYDLFYECCSESGHEFNVLVMAETEDNRTWKYADLESSYTTLLDSRTISKGETYIHINSNLMERIRSLQPDIVVVAGSYLCPGAWEIARNKKKYGYKCLFWSESHLHEQKGNSNIKNVIREIIRKKFYKKYDGFWYAGELSREFITKYAIRDAKYCFVPNLIDESIYKNSYHMSKAQKQDVRQLLQIENNKKILFCPARLSPVKGILEFLDILEKLNQKQNVVFLVAGDGELKGHIENKAKEKKLDVRLLGNKSQEEMVRLYGVADIFVLPSLSDPNPLTCIEALWAGLPLFISEHCGNYPEVIDSGNNGFVFSYKNIDAASELLEILLSQSELMREQSVCKAIHQYNSKAVTKRIIGECLYLCEK